MVGELFCIQVAKHCILVVYIELLLGYLQRPGVQKQWQSGSEQLEPFAHQYQPASF